MKKMLLIINPVSGKMKIRQSLIDILGLFEDMGYCVTVAITKRKGHASQIVSERAAGMDLVCCCGGDGTLNEVIHGLLTSNLEIPCGYIPFGSTNDFANCMGIPTDAGEAVNLIAEGTPLPLDVGRFGADAFFSYIASFGAFTSASYSTPQSSKNVLGHLAYIITGIKDISTIKPIHVSIETKNEKISGEFVFGAVMNSTSVAGLVRLDKALVDHSDGVFECMLVRMPKNIVELNKIATSLTTSNFDNDMFRFFRTSEIRFHFDTAIAWSLDGEYKNGGTDIKIKNICKGFSLIR